MPDEELNEEVETSAATTQTTTPPAARVVGRGGEIPEERVSEIRQQARKSERSRLLKEMWGTDDEEEVKRLSAAQKEAAEEAKKLKDDREKARLSEMTENERLKTELANERTARATEKTTLEQERDRYKRDLETERQDVIITGLAANHVAPKFLKTAKVEFGEYVDGLTATELKGLGPAQIEKWFTGYVKKNPEFAPAKQPVQKTAEEIEEEATRRAAAARPPVKKAPLGAARTSTQQPARPAARPAGATKDLRKMTKKEFVDHQVKTFGKRLY